MNLLSAEAPHKDIASWLEKKWGLDPWWSQEVTVQVEMATGRRITGQTAESGFQVGVSGTFPVSASRLWDYLTLKGALSWLVLEDGAAGEGRIDWKITVRKEGATSG